MARVRHGQEDWMSYHITTRTEGKAFHLAGAEEKKRILDALTFYRWRGDFRLFGFVVMDNHVHFVVQPALDHPLSAIVRDFKTWTSRNNRTKPAGEPLWERRYDDNCIRSEKELWRILKYVHENPVRAKIVTTPEDYAWSSVHNYIKDGREAMTLDADWWSE